MWLVFLLAGPVLTIPLHIPINYNEGWNAGFDTRAVTPGAGPLYPGPDSFVFDNYPPLGFFIVGMAGRMLGDMIEAGRIVALAALLGSAGLVGLCVRLLGGSPRAAVACCLLLLLFACDYYRGYVAMDDPQWLAHCLMLGGLALLLRGGVARLRAGDVSAWQVVSAASLMVAGGFVKHNLVAMPLSVTLWLFWLDRRAGLVWMIAACATVAAGLGAMDAAFGPVAFDDILHHRRIFRVHLLTHAIGRLAPLLPMAAVVALTLRRRLAGDGAVLATLFCGIALVTGVVQRMGEGVYYNAHFETLIALCLGFGLVLTASSEPPPALRSLRPWHLGPASLCAIAMLPLLGATPWHLPIAWHDIADRRAREAAWQPVIARLAATDGKVGCLMLSLCAWAGKPFTVDLFNLTQSVMAGGPLDDFRAVTASGGWAMFEDDPGSFLHNDAVRKLGRDPVMLGFAGKYSPVLDAPGGAILLGLKKAKASAPGPR